MEAIQAHSYVAMFVLGLWLTVGDQAAIAIRRIKGQRLGLLLWVGLVLVPLAVSAVLVPLVAAGGAGIATVLGGALFYRQRNSRHVLE